MLLEGVFTLPDGLQLSVIQVFQNTRGVELGGVVVGVTSNFLGTELEVSTFPEVEGVDTSTTFQFVTVHSFHDFVMDFLTVTEQEHLTLVLGVGGVLDHIDVGVVGELTLLLTDLFLQGLVTTVPQFTVVLTQGVVLTECGQGVLDVPATRTLEGVGVHLDERHVFPIGGRRKRITAKPLPALSVDSFQKRSSTVPTLVEVSSCFWSLAKELPLFLRRSEKDIGFGGFEVYSWREFRDFSHGPSYYTINPNEVNVNSLVVVHVFTGHRSQSSLMSFAC